jgi:hypothetical protein
LVESNFAENEIDQPTAPHMLSLLSVMVQYVVVRASGFFEGVGKDR